MIKGSPVRWLRVVQYDDIKGSTLQYDDLRVVQYDDKG